MLGMDSTIDTSMNQQSVPERRQLVNNDCTRLVFFPVLMIRGT